MFKLDRRRKYYLVLDCETATLPCAHKYTENEKKAVCIAKPLIYDLGWTIIDRKGNIYKKANYLIAETFSVPSVFDTAYYAEKRPIYLDMVARGELTITTWKQAVAEMEADMEACVAVGAYNSMFDFKKAIPFTELYINQLYSPSFHSWLAFQEEVCDEIAQGRRKQNEREFEKDIFRFRGKAFPLYDIWGLACKYLLDCDEYREMCKENSWYSASGKYFKTSAEMAFRFVRNDFDFDEAHTALSDAEIESEILAQIIGKDLKKFEVGIMYFPFRMVGKVEEM